ncbi:TetR/AcrR family transcriptional regulator [Williamsia herbipolensis]|uniref:TetR/AcrR family transcriptional regulator n=1 Tax=Williamsia herbipolensis TaxID=1603258 RepID=A0AAU4K2M4_9NOCA|nr:helix-turn-helix domain-containing protein [Williamsia herbipolensis]
MLSRLSIDQRRVQLIDCALDLAQRTGMSSVTVRAVAEEAGVSLGIVHYCFDSKDALMAAMIERAVGDHLAAFLRVESLDDLGGDVAAADVSGPVGADELRALLTGALTSVLDVVQEAPERWLVLIESTVVSLRAPSTSGAYSTAARQNDLAEDYGLRYLSAIGARTAMTWDGSERAVVRAALQLIYGMIQWWLVDRDDDRARTSIALLCDWITERATPVEPGALSAR